MTGHDIIVVGASAGGVEALKALVSALPVDIPAAILVVLHVPAHGTSSLPKILSRAGQLPAVHAQDDQAIQKGHIYIAPPDKHLLVKSGYLALSRGPRENGHRPAADPLFRTAARTYGARVIGVVLSGALDDGTAGLAAIKMRGGIAVVQNPDDAMYSGMPQSAIENVDVDHIVLIEQLAALLVTLANTPVQEAALMTVSEQLEMDMESDMAELDLNAIKPEERPNSIASHFGCPECGGSLWEMRDGDLFRFRCRVGHAYTPQTLLAEQSDQLEDAFWMALRALEESASLSRRLAARTRERGQSQTAERYEEQARNADERARIVREVLLNNPLGSPILDSPSASASPSLQGDDGTSASS